MATQSTKENVKNKNEIFNPEVQAIKEEFIKLHDMIPELISDDALKPLVDMIKGTDIDPVHFRNDLKLKIKKGLLEDYETLWRESNMEVNLHMLNSMKKQFEGQPPAWRPTGKTPEEQVRPIEHAINKKKLAYMEQLNKELQVELATIMPEVEANRDLMRSVLMQRSSTLQQLQNQNAYFQKISEDVKRLKRKVSEKIMEVTLAPNPYLKHLDNKEDES
uniref:CSON008463 protein n=1 Tax=Culicoides sonorensis TaxID=179676 RepID=A0A336JYQ9_CULSO